jgi:hypothetical protein
VVALKPTELARDEEIHDGHADRTRLVDKLVEAYVDWRETCARVNDAYRFWASEAGPRGRVAFGLYMAALDAEEQAAEVYAGFVRRADKLPRNEHPPTEPLGGRAWGDGWP